MRRIISIIIFSIIFCNVYSQIDRSTPPAAGPAPQINIGGYEKITLENGLQVFVVKNDQLPMVSYSLHLDIDPVLEGEIKGYVSAAGDLLRAGTTSRNKAEIDETIDFIGATLHTHSEGVYAQSLTRHSHALLEIMSDVVMNPSFPQRELETFVKRMESAIQANKSESNAIAQNIARVLRYGANDPYGELTTEETLKNIATEHLHDYHQKYFRPNVAYLIIVGDITTEKAQEQAEKYFGEWEQGAVPQHTYPEPMHFEQPKVVVANRDGAEQSTIGVTHSVNLTPGHPDAIKATLMNQVLGGGGFNSRLIQNLREDKGFTYGANSRLRTDKRVGYFSASSEVRISAADSALHEILYEMRKLQDEVVSDDDLDLMKNIMTGSFSRSLEDPQTIARFALNIERYNLPEDYYKTYLEKVAAVTAEDIKEMANKYLKPDQAIVMAVGRADELQEKLATFSSDGIVEEYDFYGNVVTGPSAVEGVSADEVIEQYIDAIGGKEALNKVSDVTTYATIFIQGMELKMKSRQKAPNKNLVETMMGDNVVSSQVFNGEKGRVASQMGVQEFEGDMLVELKESSLLFPEMRLLQPDISLKLEGIDNVDGAEAYKVAAIYPSGKKTTFFYDTETGLKLREVSVGQQGTVTTVFKEYVEKNGVQFPSRMQQMSGPQNFDILVDSIEVNTGIEDSVFDY